MSKTAIGWLLMAIGVVCGWAGYSAAQQQYTGLANSAASLFGGDSTFSQSLLSQPLFILGAVLVVAGVGLRIYAGPREIEEEEQAEQRKKRTSQCPVCKEDIVRGALVCKHCGAELEWRKQGVNK